ncbi:MAG: DUF2892 domain-containing protein [Oscillochloris sp.]|nr:DUF2892 domain-containing protein [Oscillochloris sp.]
MQEISPVTQRDAAVAHPPQRPSNVRDSERIASTMAGGAMAFYGLREARERMPALLVGGYLLYRGISGHCPIYESLDINTEASARPAHIEHSITIAADRTELYELWRDFSNLPRFMTHLQDVQVIDQKRSRWTAKGRPGRRCRGRPRSFLIAGMR